MKSDPVVPDVARQRETVTKLSQYANEVGYVKWDPDKESFDEWEYGLLMHWYQLNKDKDIIVTDINDIGFRKETGQRFAKEVFGAEKEFGKQFVQSGNMNFFSSTGAILFFSGFWLC